MAVETVYAELQVPATPGPPAAGPRLGASRSLLRISVAGNVVLAVAAVALGALAISSRRGAAPGRRDGNGAGFANGSACKAKLRELVIFLEPQCHRTAAGDSRCDFCPRDWFSHGGNCYWFSSESKTWQRSQEDCARKGARMVPGLGDEPELLENRTQGMYPVWIGSAEPPRSRRDSNRRLTSQAAPWSCRALKGRQELAEVCSAEYKWVCQKAAFHL